MKYNSDFTCFSWPYHPPPIEKELVLVFRLVGEIMIVILSFHKLGVPLWQYHLLHIICWWCNPANIDA
jgi:hypothetical protein